MIAQGVYDPTDIPMEINVKLQKEDGELLSDVTMYRRLVGSLLYLTMTRPDIAYAVQFLSQLLASPCKNHLNVVHRVLRYI